MKCKCFLTSGDRRLNVSLPMPLRTLRLLRDQFARRFAELRACSQDFALFANPFEAIVKNVPVHLQMELVDLQCDGDSKPKFAEVPLVKFYGEYIFRMIHFQVW